MFKASLSSNVEQIKEMPAKDALKCVYFYDSSHKSMQTSRGTALEASCCSLAAAACWLPLEDGCESPANVHADTLRVKVLGNE